jgi:hypothetical protein
MLTLAVTALAQMMPQAPRIPGQFKPVVGSGAQYDVTPKRGGKTQWAYVVVGKEAVQDADAYWLEMRMEGGARGGFVMKTLMVLREGAPELKRMIMQAEGQPPMEMPVEGMMAGVMKKAQESALAEASLGDKIGTESVTVPGGTFVCDHYQRKGSAGVADFWVASQVSPYGLVKMVSPDMTLELTKVLENEKSRIQGEVQKLELPRF